MSKASIDSVQAWLSLELEQRGIDAVIYTRHVLNLFLSSRYTTDHHLAKKEADIFAKLPPGTKSRQTKRKYNRRSSSCGTLDKIALKKEMAASCLLSASDEATDDHKTSKSIEMLIDDLCDKLTKLNLLSENGSSSDEGHDVGKSTDKRRESYQDAFPSLMNPPDSPNIHPDANSVATIWNGQNLFDKKTDDTNSESDKESKKHSSTTKNTSQQARVCGKSKKSSGQRSSNKRRPYPFFDASKKSPSFYKRKNGLLGLRHVKEKQEFDKENANEPKKSSSHRAEKSKLKHAGGKSLQPVLNMQFGYRSFLTNTGTTVPSESKVYETSKFKGSSRFNHSLSWNEIRKSPSMENEISHLYSAGLPDVFRCNSQESTLSSKWFLNPQSGCLEFQPASKCRNNDETSVEESWLYCPSPSLWEDEFDEFQVVGSQSRFESVYKPNVQELDEDQFLTKIKNNYEAIFTDVLKKSSSFSKAPGTDPNEIASEENTEENVLPAKKEEPKDLSLLPSFEHHDNTCENSNAIDVFSEFGLYTGHYGSYDVCHRVETCFEFTESLWQCDVPKLIPNDKEKGSVWRFTSPLPEVYFRNANGFTSVATVSDDSPVDTALKRFADWCDFGDILKDLAFPGESTSTSRYLHWFDRFTPDQFSIIPKSSMKSPLLSSLLYDHNDLDVPWIKPDEHLAHSVGDAHHPAEEFWEHLAATCFHAEDAGFTSSAAEDPVPVEAVVDSMFAAEILQVSELCQDSDGSEEFPCATEEVLQDLLEIVDSSEDKVFDDAMNCVFNVAKIITSSVDGLSSPTANVDLNNNHLNVDTTFADSLNQSRGKHDSTNSNTSLLEECITENEAWKNSVRIGNIFESISGIRPVNVLYSEKQTESDDCPAVLQPSALTHFRPIPEHELDMSDASLGADPVDQLQPAAPAEFEKPNPSEDFAISSATKKATGVCEGCSLCDSKIRGLETEFSNLLHDGSFSSDDHPACPSLQPCLPKLVDKSMQTSFEEHIRLIDKDMCGSFSVRPPKANSR